MKAIKTIALFISPLGLFLIATYFLVLPFINNFDIDLFKNQNLSFSILVSLISTFLSIAIGTSISFVSLYRNKVDSKKIFEIVLLFPHIAFAYLVFLFFSDEGVLSRLINTPLSIINDRFGIGITLNYVLKEIPFIYLILISTHSKKIKKSIHVAKTLGASSVEIFKKIYLPLMKVPIISSTIIIFAFVLGNYEVPALLGNGVNKFTSVSIIENFQSIDESNNILSYAQVFILFSISLVFSIFLKRRAAK
jgi:putative spermidine/putrescine transport system permease protein